MAPSQAQTATGAAPIPTTTTLDGARVAKKRRITAARKEQNREAQRLYRLRQKEARQKPCDTAQRKVDSRRRPLRPRPGPASDAELLGSTTEKDDSAVQSSHGSSASQTSVSPPPLFSMSISSYTGSVDTMGFLLPDVIQVPYEEADSSSPSSNDSMPLERVRPLPSRLDNPQELMDRARGATTTSEVTFFDGRSHMRSGWSKRSRESLFFADVYMNAMQFAPTSIFCAIADNALALGFDMDELISCRLDYNSPFYRPNATSRDDPEALLKFRASPALTLHAHKGNEQIPMNLRPTPAQILIPHHASLDLIPLAPLRETAIMLAAAMPHLFNTWELKLDIYVRGGLTMWQRDGPGSRGGNCRPWDTRFWEAQPWFLRKWSMAVGGEQGELGKQSAGWRALRESRSSSLQPALRLPGQK